VNFLVGFAGHDGGEARQSTIIPFVLKRQRGGENTDTYKDKTRNAHDPLNTGEGRQAVVKPKTKRKKKRTTRVHNLANVDDVVPHATGPQLHIRRMMGENSAFIASVQQ
jgi:hypothetical protein